MKKQPEVYRQALVMSLTEGLPHKIPIDQLRKMCERLLMDLAFHGCEWNEIEFNLTAKEHVAQDDACIPLENRL